MEEQIWGNIGLEKNESRYFSIGDLHLWVNYRDEEIWIAYAYSDELKNPESTEAPPEHPHTQPFHGINAD